MSAESDDDSVIIRLKSKCASCLVADAIYKCPACSVVSCSCACVKAHKQKTGCTGIATPALAVSNMEMDVEEEFYRGVRFLQKIESRLEACLRDTRMHHLDDEDIPQGRSRHRSKFSNKNKNRNCESVKIFRNDVTHIQKRFRFKVKERGTQLAFMPRDMSRHSVNSSHYIPRLKTIRWHVRVEFVHADVCFEDTVDERSTIGRIVARYLEVPVDQLRGWTIAAPGTSHTDKKVRNVNGMESMCKTKGNLKDPLEDGWSELRKNNGDSASKHCNGENGSCEESGIISESLSTVSGSATVIDTVNAQPVFSAPVSQGNLPRPSSDVISTILNPYCTTRTSASSIAYDSSPEKILVREICSSSDTSRGSAQPLSSDQSTQMLAYQSAGLGQLVVLCKNEMLDFCSRYEITDKSDTLKEALVGLRIVEHPILLVLRKDHAYEFLKRDGVTDDQIGNIIKSGSSLKPDYEKPDTVENSLGYFAEDYPVDDMDNSAVL